MSIAALVVWSFTVAAGFYLLMTLIGARRGTGRTPAAPDTRSAPGTVPGPAATANPVTAQSPATAQLPVTAQPLAVVGSPATAATPADPPPIPRPKVTAGPDDHPLREFSHPALGITGLACWLAFVATHYRGFGWAASVVLAGTAGVGLGWLASNARAAGRRWRPRARGDTQVPLHLIVLHGLAAAVTCGLVALTLLTATHI